MPDCNIRNIDESLMRAMKSRALAQGLTLRDFAIKAFVAAVNWELRGEKMVEHIPEEELPKFVKAWAPMEAGKPSPFRPIHAVKCTCAICKPQKEK